MIPTIYPHKVLLGIQEGNCNLSCPKCHTHGKNKKSGLQRPAGKMDFDAFVKIADELKTFKPRVAPQTWDEPFMNAQIFKYLEVLKERDLVVTIDTNGLLLTEEKIQNLIDLKVDSVFISLDAHTSEMFKLTRGIEKLDFLHELVFLFLKKRGSRLLPRIGVSFVLEEVNEQEMVPFVNFWKNHVDVVRVNQIFSKTFKTKNPPQMKRLPCWSLYDSLMIHYNGESALCCMDNYYQNKIGNVFEHGVLGVWNGPFFKLARESHENGNFKFGPLCGNCDLWSNDAPTVVIDRGILISQSHTHTYYNRQERLANLPQNRFLEQGISDV